MKKIAYSKQAIKTLSKLPVNESSRIRSKLRQYADDPASQANNVRKLQGGVPTGSGSATGASYSMRTTSSSK
jgi:mRNA-degrading endonuclease RelE of RelBE toxin-antitoxin system